MRYTFSVVLGLILLIDVHAQTEASTNNSVYVAPPQQALPAATLDQGPEVKVDSSKSTSGEAPKTDEAISGGKVSATDRLATGNDAAARVRDAQKDRGADSIRDFTSGNGTETKNTDAFEDPRIRLIKEVNRSKKLIEEAKKKNESGPGSKNRGEEISNSLNPSFDHGQGKHNRRAEASATGDKIGLTVKYLGDDKKVDKEEFYKSTDTSNDHPMAIGERKNGRFYFTEYKDDGTIEKRYTGIAAVRRWNEYIFAGNTKTRITPPEKGNKRPTPDSEGSDNPTRPASIRGINDRKPTTYPLGTKKRQVTLTNENKRQEELPQNVSEDVGRGALEAKRQPAIRPVDNDGTTPTPGEGNVNPVGPGNPKPGGPDEGRTGDPQNSDPNHKRD